MHILLLAPSISIHSQRFLRMLLEAGHGVTLLDSYNPISEDIRGYAFVPFHIHKAFRRPVLRLLSQLQYLLQAVELRKVWRKVRPDIVHVHWLDARAYVCAMAELHPLILTCWGSDINNLFSQSNEKRDARKRTTRALLAADHITADSIEVLHRCELLTKRTLDKSLFFYGIDMNRFRPGYLQQAQALRHACQIPLDATVILSPRAMRPPMGHHSIIEAFANLATRPEYTKLMLALKRYLPLADDYETVLRRRITELGLTDRVVWLPPASHKDMPIEYAMADVVINYPEQDGFPVTFFEAAACKRPVVSSSLAAYSGSFVHTSFWMAEPSDVAALTSALHDCLCEPRHQLEDRLTRAREEVLRIGSQDASLASIVATYNRVMVVRH